MRQMHAVKVTEENLEEIVAYAKKHQLDISHLQDNLEFHADYGWDTMIVVHSETRPTAHILYFDDMDSCQFFNRYFFTNGSTHAFSPTGTFKEIQSQK